MKTEEAHQVLLGWGGGSGSSIQNCRVYAQFYKYSIYIFTKTSKKRLKRNVLENEHYLWVVK